MGPICLEKLDVVVGHLGLQLAGGHQVVVVVHLVAAMLLGEVQRLVRLAEDLHRRTRGGADEADAHRHVAHLREGVRLHGFAKALESLACRFQGGVA